MINNAGASCAFDVAPLDIGTDKQLLFDDFLTTRKQGFTTEVGAPLGREGPFIVPDRPWEDHAIYLQLSVAQLEDRLQLWYPSADEKFAFHMCYAESTDGRHWVKPECGVVEYHGNTANNIVYDGHGEVVGPVFLDPTAPPERRYKGVFPGTVKFPPGALKLTAAYSPDGIHWTWCGKEGIIPWYYDTFSSVFWDPRIGKYVLYARDNVGWTERYSPYYRAVNRSESADFENFPEPVRVLESTESDPQEGQLYNPGVILYPGAANAYFAFPSPFYRLDMFDVRLFTSRDGICFTEPLDAPFLTVGPAGCFDAMMIHISSGCVIWKDEVWLYYSGFRGGHTILPGALDAVEHPRWGGVGLLRMRLDGFVSQRAGREEGTLLTRPFRFAGNRLQVNMNASAGGCLQVEILSAVHKPIPGFTMEEADLLHGNDIRKTVTWSGNPDVSALAGQEIRLRFRGKAVDLYAFQFLNA